MGENKLKRKKLKYLVQKRMDKKHLVQVIL